LRVQLVLFLFLVAACGGPNGECDGALLSGTCNGPSVGLCLEFADLSTADLKAEETFCAKSSGTFGQAPCPTSARVGTCLVSGTAANLSCSPSGTVTTRYFAPYGTTDAFLSCMDGTFTAN
jgi:hypothetical protein